MIYNNIFFTRNVHQKYLASGTMNFKCDLAFQCIKSVLAGSIMLQISLSQGCQKVFKQQADKEQQAALELAPKAQVLEGRGIQGYFEIKSLGNGASRGFQVEFSTTDAMCFVRIHTKLETMPSKCPRCSTTLHCPNVSQI